MKVRVPLFFIAAIVTVAGIYFRSWEAFIVAIVIFFLSIKYYRLLKWFEISRQPLSEEQEYFLNRYSTYYPHLTGNTRKQFERNFRLFLSRLPVEGEDGKLAALEMRLYIAMGFSTVLIGRPDWKLPLPRKVVVLPGGRLEPDMGIGKGDYAACATRETLYMTEKNLEISFKNSRDRYNNVFHELAHYFDSEDNTIDGKPFFYRRIKDSKTREYFYFEWKKVINHEYERARKGEIHIRPYALQSIGEFFACAVEYFMEDPGALKWESEDLYNLLLRFFNFDPVKLLGTPLAKN